MGRVQYVTFRHNAVEMARSLHLVGFVQNEADGSVYAEVEGESKAVDAFSDWFKNGPPPARVTGVEIHEKPLQDFTDFRVR
jgi:acylphosphatase